MADVFSGWKAALEELGCKVVVYNTNERLSFYGSAHVPDYAQEPDEGGERPLRKALTDDQAMAAAMQGLSHELYTVWPDVVFFVSAFYVSAQVLQVIRARRHKVVILHTESPYQDDEQLIRAQYADVNLLNDPANLDDYKALVPSSFYMPHAYNPSVHFPRWTSSSRSYESDFAFVGTIFQSRRKFFEEMLAEGAFRGLSVAMGGSGWDAEWMGGSPLLEFLGHPRGECMDNAETAEAYRASRSGMNFYRRESEGEHRGEGWALGPREVEMAACGLPFIRDPRGESDELFGSFLPSFGSASEAAEQLQWLLRNDNRRRDLGRKARAAIMDRTFRSNALFLLRKLDELQ